MQDWTGCDSLILSIRQNNDEILNCLLDYTTFVIDLNKRFFVN